MIRVSSHSLICWSVLYCIPLTEAAASKCGAVYCKRCTVQAGNPDQCARLKLKARPAVHCASISTAVLVFHFLLSSCSLQTSAADPFTPSADRIRYLLLHAACSMHLSVDRQVLIRYSLVLVQFVLVVRYWRLCFIMKNINLNVKITVIGAHHGQLIVVSTL